MAYWRIHPAVLAAIVVLGACERGAPATEDHADPPAPDLVELDSAQVIAAGVTLGRVEALPPDTIYLTGTITFDAARVSHVGPRTQGRLRRVDVEIGSRVSASDTLAVLDSPELGA
ncbi:MAG: efflux RND transporter periplasmic adaptor subunit, partial [Candidatus Binatia bacterium]